MSYIITKTFTGKDYDKYTDRDEDPISFFICKVRKEERIVFSKILELINDLKVIPIMESICINLRTDHFTVVTNNEYCILEDMDSILTIERYLIGLLGDNNSIVIDDNRFIEILDDIKNETSHDLNSVCMSSHMKLKVDVNSKNFYPYIEWNSEDKSIISSFDTFSIIDAILERNQFDTDKFKDK